MLVPLLFCTPSCVSFAVGCCLQRDSKKHALSMHAYKLIHDWNCDLTWLLFTSHQVITCVKHRFCHSSMDWYRLRRTSFANGMTIFSFHRGPMSIDSEFTAKIVVFRFCVMFSNHWRCKRVTSTEFIYRTACDRACKKSEWRRKHYLPYSTVYITHPWSGFPSSIARQPRGRQYQTIHLREKVLARCFERQAFRHRHSFQLMWKCRPWKIGAGVWDKPCTLVVYGICVDRCFVWHRTGMRADIAAVQCS